MDKRKIFSIARGLSIPLGFLLGYSFQSVLDGKYNWLIGLIPTFIFGVWYIYFVIRYRKEINIR